MVQQKRVLRLCTQFMLLLISTCSTQRAGYDLTLRGDFVGHQISNDVWTSTTALSFSFWAKANRPTTTTSMTSPGYSGSIISVRSYDASSGEWYMGIQIADWFPYGVTLHGTGNYALDLIYSGDNWSHYVVVINQGNHTITCYQDTGSTAEMSQSIDYSTDDVEPAGSPVLDTTISSAPYYFTLGAPSSEYFNSASVSLDEVCVFRGVMTREDSIAVRRKGCRSLLALPNSHIASLASVELIIHYDFDTVRESEPRIFENVAGSYIGYGKLLAGSAYANNEVSSNGPIFNPSAAIVNGTHNLLVKSGCSGHPVLFPEANGNIILSLPAFGTLDILQGDGTALGIIPNKTRVSSGILRYTPPRIFQDGNSISFSDSLGEIIVVGRSPPVLTNSSQALQQGESLLFLMQNSDELLNVEDYSSSSVVIDSLPRHGKLFNIQSFVTDSTGTDKPILSHALSAEDLPILVVDVYKRILYQHDGIEFGIGLDSFTCHAVDSLGQAGSIGAISFDVSFVNMPPVSSSSKYTLLESSETKPFQVNATDPNDDVIGVWITRTPQHGTLYMNALGASTSKSIPRSLIGYDGANVLVSQWPVAASASSSYPGPKFDASRLIGPPSSYPQSSDLVSEWEPADLHCYHNTLTLTYKEPVYVSEVNVYQLYNPGSFVMAEVLSPEGEWIVVWMHDMEVDRFVGDGSSSKAAFALIERAIVNLTFFKTATVRVTIDLPQTCLLSTNNYWLVVDTVQVKGWRSLPGQLIPNLAMASLVYIPEPYYNGPDSFDFLAFDLSLFMLFQDYETAPIGHRGGSIEFTITPVNNAPSLFLSSSASNVTDLASFVASLGSVASKKDHDVEFLTDAGIKTSILTLQAVDHDGGDTHTFTFNFIPPGIYLHRLNCKYCDSLVMNTSLQESSGDMYLTDINAGAVIAAETVHVTVSSATCLQGGVSVASLFSVTVEDSASATSPTYQISVILSCNLKLYVLPTSIQTVSFIICGLASLFLLSVSYFVWTYRSTNMIIGTSYIFAQILIYMMLLVIISAIMFASNVGSSSLCFTRLFIGSFGLVGALGVLILKMQRLQALFFSKIIRRVTITDSDLLRQLLVILLAEVGIIVSALISHGFVLEQEVGTFATQGYIVSQCELTSVFANIVYYIQLGVIGFMGLHLTILAWHTRNAPSLFNESKAIFNCIMIGMSYAAMSSPVGFFVSDNPAAIVALISSGCGITIIAMTAAMFGPKLRMAYRGDENADMSLNDSDSTTTATGTGTKSERRAGSANGDVSVTAVASSVSLRGGSGVVIRPISGAKRKSSEVGKSTGRSRPREILPKTRPSIVLQSSKILPEITPKASILRVADPDKDHVLS